MFSSESKLILLPNLLSGESVFKRQFAEFLRPAIQDLDGLFIESMKGGRAFMSLFKEAKLNGATLSYVNEHTRPDEYDFLLEPLLDGQRWGLVSDAGLPAVADPGARLVLAAHQKGVKVTAYGVNSSIMGALMLSGLPGQDFRFHGYLPRDEKGREGALQAIEAESKQNRSSQIFIEAPYRNEAMFEAILQSLKPSTWLSIATDLTAPTEEVRTMRIKQWKKEKVDLQKRPTVWVLCDDRAGH